MSKKWILSGCLVAVFLLFAIWMAFNPPSRFGIFRFGLTVYSGIPFPIVDVVVYANGLPGIRGSKAHFISVEEFENLLGPRADAWPDVVIIGTGYEGMVRVEESIQTWADPAVEVLLTPQAILRYNELRVAGRRVAAIIHSTC